MKRHILFVGEIQPLWIEFQVLAADSNSGISGDFFHTVPEALAAIEKGGFTAVVADADLPGIGGVELLDTVMRRRPEVRRFVLSDLADIRATVGCLGRGHHHLLKPCDTQTLLSALERANGTGSWQPGQAAQELIAEMRRLPSPPTIYFQVCAEIESPNASHERIGELIARDPAISAKVMQLANSAVFGLQLQVVHPFEAVIYIGLETTRSLVLAAHTFSAFDQAQIPNFPIDDLWRHCVIAGRLARQIVRLERGAAELADQSFAAGLLHDIGKLLFAANLPQLFRQAVALAREQGQPLWKAEREVAHACHAELGAALLAIWGLPAPIVEAVAWHHWPSASPELRFCPLTAVHAADVLAHEARPDPKVPVQAGLDLDYLEGVGLADRTETWRRNCLADEPLEAAAND